ncbi:MAG TPA: hypothetical protein VEF04_09080, partial [Blastocatellia bacterium]|nr:hypothetical protein [Blastocatellia bacterium]
MMLLPHIRKITLRALLLVLGVLAPLTAQSQQKASYIELKARFDSLWEAGRGYESLLDDAKAMVAPGTSDPYKLFLLARIYDKSAVESTWGNVLDPRFNALNDSAIHYFKEVAKLDPHFYDDRYQFHTVQFLSHCYGIAMFQALRERNDALLKDLISRANEDRAFPKALLAYGRALLENCDPNAILFVAGDDDTFPLLYLQHANGVRKDVTLINTSLLSLPWYSKMVKEGRAGR